ncbi:hypothetical protein D3C77_558700 [compost metagenome]
MGKAGLREQGRQLHAASVEVAAGIEETGFKEGINCRLHLWDQHRFAIFETRLMFVALAVVRREIFLGDSACRVQGGVKGLAIVLGKARALGKGLGIEYFVEFEGQVAGAEQSLGHDGIPVRGWPSLGREAKAAQLN